MRAIFSAGVVDCLLEEGIAFDEVYGVSAGACHGCSFVSGQKGRAFRAMADNVGNPEYGSLRNFLRTGDWFSERYAWHEVPERLTPLDYAAFSVNPCRLRAVVTDCRTGKAEYPVVEDCLRDIDLVRASSSLPLLSRMVPWNGGLYLDGGISDSIPVLRARSDGHGKCVVALTRPASYRKGPNRLMPLMRLKYRKWPALLKAIETRHLRYNETLDELERLERAGEVFVVRPAAPLEIGRLEKDRSVLEAGWREGLAAARALVPALREYLSGPSGF